jgi:hypothetical protein
MILNARNNNYTFRFPKGFIPENIEKKYEPILLLLPQPFANVTEYLNFAVQSVTFPRFDVTEASQVSKNQRLNWRGGWDLLRSQAGEVVVTFKATEGHITYFLMLDLLADYLDYGYAERNEGAEFMPSLHLHLLDWTGNLFLTFQMEQVTMSSLSELELSFPANAPDAKSYTATFGFNLINIIHPDEF